MAISASVDVGGVRRAWWDDDIEQYIEVASDGTTETLRRTYTDVEKEQKAERIARVRMRDTDASQRDRLREGLPRIRAGISAIDTLSQNSTGNTRTLATHLLTSLKANLALAKLLTGDLSVDE